MSQTNNAPQKETRSFETEIQELLNLIAHSLYSNREIFIRELVSNASDAIDRLRFLSLTDEALLEDDPHFRIHIRIDPERETLTVSDNGIGMDREELVRNIGTIARSGSREFLKSLSGKRAEDLSLIGRFGVGFYSVFMVANKVTLTTRKAGHKQAFEWESEGKGGYTIRETEKSARGTEITLFLNEEGREFLEDWRVRSVIRKFSDFVTYDILMPEIDTRSEEQKEKDAALGKLFKPKEEVVNTGKALWTRPRDEITDEMYEEFYRHVSHDHNAPLAKVHFKQEGLTTFTAILYIPSRAPFDLFTNLEPGGVQLFVNRVFILDDSKTLLPTYLRFVKGIVDTEDLPLNVSREMLQQNRNLEKIKKALTKKILSLLKELSEKEPEKYVGFWKELGVVLKEGVFHDADNRDRIAPLLRYPSSLQDRSDSTVSLDEYASRMKEGQNDIYYITAENRAQAEASPHLEIFRKKGLEVLFMLDPVDEWVVSSLGEFSGKKLTSIVKGKLDLGDFDREEKDAVREAERELKSVEEFFRKNLQDEIKEVRASSRLTDSPCCLVADENALSPNLERILKMSRRDVGDAADPVSKKILEINPRHPVIRNLKSLLDADAGSGEAEDWVRMLYDQALLAGGTRPEDPRAFNERLNRLLVKAMHPQN